MSGEPGIMTCKGVNGTITFDGTWVKIDRKGLLARTTVGKGEKRIALTQISSVRWKAPTMMGPGFISFSLPGSTEVRSYDARHDENAVLVNRSQVNAFRALKDKIEEAVAQHNAPSPSPAAVVPTTPDPAEQLKKLAELHQGGLLTDERICRKESGHCRSALVGDSLRRASPPAPRPTGPDRASRVPTRAPRSDRVRLELDRGCSVTDSSLGYIRGSPTHDQLNRVNPSTTRADTRSDFAVTLAL